MTVTHTNDTLARPRSSGLLRAGLRFLFRRPRALAALAGWSLLEALHTFALGFGLAHALDDGFLAGRTATGLAWLAVTALVVPAGALGSGRVHVAVGALAEPLRDELVRTVVRNALEGAVQRAVGKGASAGSGDEGSAVVSRLTHQVEIARDSFAGVVTVSRSFLFTAVGALAGLLSLAPLLLLVVVPPLLLGLALFGASLRPMARRQLVFLKADEDIAQELGTSFSGLRDVVACGAEDRMLLAGRRRVEAERRAAESLARWGVIRALALGVGGRLPIVLVLVLAPWLLSRGVTTGALAGALTYLTQALMPALQSLVHGLGSASARLAVVIRRLRGQEGGPEGSSAAAKPAVLPPPSTAPSAHAPALAAKLPARVPAPRGDAGFPPPAVELSGVSFRYGEGAAPVIDRLGLVVPAGGHLAVVGPSGIGKSTLASLIAGLVEPEAGGVRVGGLPASSSEAAGARVIIPQEAYVFSGTLRENLVHLCPVPPPDTAVTAALTALGAEDLAVRLGGLEGAVAPDALSAGERQLIALVRAHLSPAPLAVLDEATCHLDPAAEGRAERAFAARASAMADPGSGDGSRVAEGPTCEGRPFPGGLIVIAHRVSSALRADRVLVLDGARADCGTHAELLERSALYRDLAAGWDPSAASSQPARSL